MKESAMRCKVRVLRDIEAGHLKIPAGTHLVIDDDRDYLLVSLRSSWYLDGDQR